MSTKKLQDYIHLYIGCDVQHITDDGTTAQLIGVVGGTVHLLNNDHNQYGTASFTEVKLILRQLSDMTEEEQDEVWYAGESLGVIEMNSNSRRRKVVLCPDRTIYLISKGFDLFGLIDAGLAVRKPQLQTA